MYQRLLVACLAVGCSGSGNRAPASGPASQSPAAATPDPALTPPSCDDRVLVIQDGREGDSVCASAVPKGTTIVDLRDAWTPVLFAVQPDGTAPEFRANYLALAIEQDLDGKKLPPNIGLAELYGVVPSFAIVRDRFAQTARYACHAKVDSAPLAKITRPYGQELSALVRFNNRQRELLGAILERARVQRNLPDYAALATDRELGPAYERWKTADDLYSGIVAAQRHLVCEGSMSDKDADGTFSWVLG
ncbi:MAG TPA: hypothetical protein VLB44_22515, partial [Kofleriaceae bacterium]|nr:hypothetical protein [Kofleriaceae bacterium]